MNKKTILVSAFAIGAFTIGANQTFANTNEGQEGAKNLAIVTNFVNSASDFECCGYGVAKTAKELKQEKIAEKKAVKQARKAEKKSKNTAKANS